MGIYSHPVSIIKFVTNEKPHHCKNYWDTGTGILTILRPTRSPGSIFGVDSLSLAWHVNCTSIADVVTGVHHQYEDTTICINGNPWETVVSIY